MTKLALRNNMRLFATVFRKMPMYVLLFLVEGILMGINQAVGIYHIHHIFDLIEEHAAFEPIAHILLEFAVYLLLHYAFYHWFCDRYRPVAGERLHLLLGDTLLVEQGDTPPMQATRRVLQHVDEVLEDVSHFFTHLLASVAITVLLLQVDWQLALVCLFACAIRLSVASYHNRSAARHHQELHEFEEQEDISGAFNLKADALRDYSHRKRALISKGSRHLARITFAAEGGMTLVDFGVILLMVYKELETGTVSLGGVAVAMTALWILSWQLRSLFDRVVRLCNA